MRFQWHLMPWKICISGGDKWWYFNADKRWIPTHMEDTHRSKTYYSLLENVGENCYKANIYPCTGKLRHNQLEVFGKGSWEVRGLILCSTHLRDAAMPVPAQLYSLTSWDQLAVEREGNKFLQWTHRIHGYDLPWMPADSESKFKWFVKQKGIQMRRQTVAFPRLRDYY